MTECVPVVCGQDPSSTPQLIQTVPEPEPAGCNAVSNYGNPHQAVGKHPVSLLYEIQAKNHDSAPIFKDVAERCQQNQNEFQVQVMVDDRIAFACGYTKKEAKRRAAIEMLKQMHLPIESEESNNMLESY